MDAALTPSRYQPCRSTRTVHRGKQQLREAKTFGDFAAKWLEEYRMEESTRAMRESVLNRDVLPHSR
ncbi:hypothetical protein [Paraburkholderia youngii]|uniref:hypothetical protein n=1 Tax=Paraburkholderia youngii TaxID=2782701 RepID=UPI003D1B31FD